MTKIIALESENIKRIKAIKIKPKPNSNVIAGKNGNGKTSLLDTILMALGGKDLIPTRPVREGETKARAFVDLGDLRITRHWTTPELSYLQVETREGAKLAQPQKELDKILGELSFDPLEFATKEPKERLQILKKIAKVDFTELDKEYKTKFDHRTEVNREGQTIKAQLEDLAVLPDLQEMRPEAEIKEELEKLNKQNQDIVVANQVVKNLKENLLRTEQAFGNIDEDIKKLIQKKEDLSKEVEKIKLDIIDREAVANVPYAKTDELEAQLNEIKRNEANKNLYKKKEELQAKRETKAKEWEELTARLKEIDATKIKLIQEAKFPIQGIALGDGEVLFNGIPFGQLSTSEQIRVSMAVAISLNPKLKLILIRNGSLLDDDAMAEIERIALDQDFQVFIERVSSKPDGNSIFIEEGEVKE